MPREITHHKCSDLNNVIGVFAVDERNAANGNCNYQMISNGNTLDIHFQEGAVKEKGVNGFSDEALLAVVIDRLEGFQKGPFSCRENAIAVTHLQDAMHWLQHRTRDRMQRGVEGLAKP